MHISDVLRSKGSVVATISPAGTVTEVLAELARHDVGALVVVDDGAVVGIVSERDVARRFHDRGPAVLDAPVSEIMTAEVLTCAPDYSIDALARTMTERRIRHIPVVVAGELVGIVSLGDVVKSRINELETDSQALHTYIAG